MMSELTNREKLVLKAIVKNFIDTANPVGSHYIARHSHLAFSPATIRNIMASLEEKGYLFQPYTSAGRVPTSAAYRVYVDQMMGRSRLTSEEKEKIRQVVQQSSGDLEAVLKEAIRILAHLSHQLGIVISPHLDEGIFHRMDITRLTSERLLLIISIKSGLVKTIMLDIRSGINDRQLDFLRQVLNERLSGRRLRDIRHKFQEIVQDIRNEESGLIRLIIRAVDKIFDFSEDSDVYLTGTHHMLRHPEFSDYQKISGVVELLEDKRIVIHLLDESTATRSLNVKIGDEIGEQKMKQCSIITAKYKIDQVSGTLAIVGPMRMNYSHLVPLVDYTARVLSSSFV